MSSALWLHNVVAWSVQVTGLIAAGSLALATFRITAPRIRLAFAQSLLALCLLLPLAQPWRHTDRSQIEVTMTAARPALSTSHPARTFPWREVLLILFAAGSVTRLLWLGAGFRKLHNRRRMSIPLEPLPAALDRLREALAPRVEFLMSAVTPGPVTFGFRRAVIVLPVTFTELPENIQQAIACHELLHVRRHDWIVTLAEECIRTALWFHPAVWWLLGQIQLAREQTVDGAVVSFTRDRAQYLNALLAIAGDRAVPDLAPAPLFLRKRHLKKRVALLLKEITMSKRRIVSFCAASCGLLLAAGWLTLRTFPLEAAPLPQEQVESNLLHSVSPQYPREAREKHIEGSVVLELQIEADGHVSDARVVSGPRELRGAALTAVLQWHYSPKTMTLPTTTQTTINFMLPKEGATQPSQEVLPESGRFTIEGIDVRNMSASARDGLVQQLPAHVGDSIDAAGLRSMVENVHAYDDDLQVSVSPDRSNQLLISIAPAGTQEEHAATAETKKIRIGGTLQQTKLLVQTRPIYPSEAKAKGIQGQVMLEATIAKDGRVADLRVLSGDPVLAAAATDAVRTWRYSTTLLNGDPVDVVTNISVNFTLAP